MFSYHIIHFIYNSVQAFFFVHHPVYKIVLDYSRDMMSKHIIVKWRTNPTYIRRLTWWSILKF